MKTRVLLLFEVFHSNKQSDRSDKNWKNFVFLVENRRSERADFQLKYWSHSQIDEGKGASTFRSFPFQQTSDRSDKYLKNFVFLVEKRRSEGADFQRKH